MKTKVLNILIVLLFLGTSIFAQTVDKQVIDRNGNPSFIKFDTRTKAVSINDSKILLQQYLLNGKAVGNDFKLKDSQSDKRGLGYEKYQQYYNGIIVDNGVYIVQQKNGVITSMSGEFKQIDNLNITPSISLDNARQKAISFVGASEYMWSDDASYYPKGELVIVQSDFGKRPTDPQVMVLAYKFNVYAKKPLSRAYIYVDAHTGNIVHTNAIIKTAVADGNGDTRYSGNKDFNTDSYNGSYRLRDYSRGNGIIIYDMNQGTNYNSAVDFTDSDNSWTAAEFDNTNKDNIGIEAAWAFQEIYDYWLNVHGRNSFDNSGALMKAYVHYDDAYDNAYWDGSVFTFGDGSDTYFDALASLDVSAHEHGHAVCSYTCDLTYSYEPGALNEAFSDIWGACLEAYAAPEKSIWVMGEDIERRTGHEGLRILSDPNAEGLPDTYQGTYWVSSSTDYGGVHTNNGPFCYWFYLISEGGSGTNDNGDSYSVSAIGIEKAEQITFLVESSYFTSSTNYSAARTYVIEAAEQLYGAGSAEVQSVTNAMYAVGVGDAYDGGGSSTGAEFCTSKGSNYSYEWIASVVIGSYTNTSSAAGYTDFTSENVELTPGESYSVTLTPGFASSSYSEYYKIWIDYDNDTTFADDEVVFSSNGTSAVSGTITIPSDATGTVRMRVSMKYNAAQTACETFSYGEVEDYNVTFTSGSTADTQAPTAPTNLASSNVTTSSCSLSWTASTDNVGVTGYDVYRNGTLLASTTSTSYSVTGLSASTTYSFYVKAKDAAGNVSSASSTLSVTTSTASDTQAPTAPTGLAASGVTSSSLTLSWTASTDNVAVTGYDVYRNGTLLASTTSTSYSVTGLTASTTYTFYVKAKDAAGNVSSASSTVSATTSTDAITYCTSKGNNYTYEWIDLVQLGDINNTSGASGYTDFTSLSTNLARGASATIYFSAGFKSSSYKEYWHVWIDFDHNGTFDDDEKMVTGNSTSSSTLSGTFTVPTDAVLGSTRMRVTMKYYSSATSCETFSYGEVEDYTVNIVETYAGFASTIYRDAEELGIESSEMVKLYPNPVEDILNIELQAYRPTARIYNAQGMLIMVQDLDLNTTVDVSNLSSGVYFVKIDDPKEPIVKFFVKK